MSNSTIVLRALEAELDRVLESINATDDEMAVIYRDEPESHVFFGSDLEQMQEEDREIVGHVMDRDVADRIEWLTDTIGQLTSRNVREEGGLLFECEGAAAAEAEAASEARYFGYC